MLNTVIYISDQEMIAVNARSRRKKIVISDIFRMSIPQDCVMNGYVADENEVERLLTEFWKKYPLSRKSVTLVLESTQVVSKVIWVPSMNHTKMMEYLPREFVSVERAKDQIYSYLELTTEGKMKQVWATMAERSMLEFHIALFEHAGVKLTSIVAAGASELQLLLSLPYLRGKTCMVQILDGLSILHIVLLEGKFYHLSRIRLFDEYGTAAFYGSCVREILGQQQYAREEHPEVRISQLYLAGEFQPRDYGHFEERIGRLESPLSVHVLTPDEENGRLELHEEGKAEFSHLPMLLGGVLIEAEGANLYRQYKRDSRQERAARRWLSYLTPLFLTMGIGSFIVLFQVVFWMFQFGRIREQQEFIDRNGLVAIEMEYDRTQQENESLKARADVLQKTELNRKSYPDYSLKIKHEILECAAGDANVFIQSFDGESGAVTVTGTSESPNGINEFVRRLSSDKPEFSLIEYNGYLYNEEAGFWETTLTCYLSE